MPILTDNKHQLVMPEQLDGTQPSFEVGKTYGRPHTGQDFLDGQQPPAETSYLDEVDSAIAAARTAVEAAQPDKQETNSTYLTPEQISSLVTNAGARVVGMRTFYVAGQDQDFISTVRQKTIN